MDGRSQGIAVIAPCLPSSDLAFEESNVPSVRHRNGSSGPYRLSGFLRSRTSLRPAGKITYPNDRLAR